MKINRRILTCVGVCAVALTLLFIKSALSEGDVPRRANAAPNATPSSLENLVNDALELRASEVSAVRLEHGRGGSVSVQVLLGSQSRRLMLGPASVRAAGYTLKIQEADGSYRRLPPGPQNTYRGYVEGEVGSAVAASVRADGLHARVLLADGREFWVEPLASRVQGAGRDDHAVYRTEDILPTGRACDAHQGMQLALAENGEVSAAGTACGSGLCIAEVAVDADFEYFQDWGSVAAVEDRINAVINGLNIQYERDVAVKHVISAIIVRTAEPDPYSSSDALTLLYEFRNQWIANHGDVQRDMAQLFTGKAINGGTIGIAWVGAVCGSYGFSVVESDFNGSFGCATDLSAHEFGHNWNARHCDCSSPSYTMNPYITCANAFHPSATVPSIESYRDSRSCLSAGATCSSDIDCDDGLFCTGVEVCIAGICESTGDLCPGEDCDEGIDGCVPRICDDNGVCAGDEDCLNCPGDCPTLSGSACGNAVCETAAGEDCVSCPQDCNGRQNGNPRNRYCCGESGDNPVTCSDGRCTASGNTCSDAPSVPSCCGDGVCQGAEDECICENDCGSPPSVEEMCADGLDNDCDGDADCRDPDCADGPECSSPAGCGNGVCDAGEDCISCASDCAGKQNGRPSGRYCCGNGVLEGPEGDGSLCDGNP